jgi:type IV fimbrial biogenesis protein FimT
MNNTLIARKTKPGTKPSAFPSRRPGGFTLPELLVTMLIAAIAVTTALPGLRDFLAAQQLISASNAFLHAIHQTRSEAMQRNDRMQMSPLDGKDWRSGWRIHAPENGALPAAIVSQHDALPSGLAISYTGGGQIIGYQENGQPARSGSWHFSLSGQSRVIYINFLGRARICDPQRDGNCGAA